MKFILFKNSTLSDCINLKIPLKRFSNYSQIYSFTTEKISEYFPKFDFKDKKVLVIGSSGDHIINAFLQGAEKVSAFDINYLAGFFSDLKLTALSYLAFEDFKTFFLINSKSPMNYQTYCSFRQHLNSNTKLFFDNLYIKYKNNGFEVRHSIFFNNLYDKNHLKISNNLYLHSEELYNQVKKSIKKKQINFLLCSIEELQPFLLKSKFDLIFLSNISDYSRDLFKNPNYLNSYYNQIILPLQNHIKNDGILCIAYIYDTGSKKFRSAIDNPNIRKAIFSKSNFQYSEISFKSTIPKKKDAVLILKNSFNLKEKSNLYSQKINVYQDFSEAEDFPGLILNFLKDFVSNKIVLDLGCGSGKYLFHLSKFSKKYYGLDISQDQINFIKRSSIPKNTKLICSSAEVIPLKNNSIDLIIACWVVGTIPENNRRLKVIEEIKRVLKRGGFCFFIENDIGGEFEFVRNRYPRIKETKNYNNFLESQGFKVYKKIKTYFQFKSKKQAQSVFGIIWGDKVRKKIKDSKLNHKVVVYLLKN